MPARQTGCSRFYLRRSPLYSAPCTGRIERRPNIFSKNLKEPAYERIVKAQLMAILGLLGRKYAALLCAQSAPAGEHLRQMDMALNYINENLTQGLTLDQAARAANMSRSFRLVTRRSPSEYRKALRQAT